MIAGLLDSGALPTLERFVQFAGERHRVLTNNIANLDTPYFKPRDLSVNSFQAELSKAIGDRREQKNPLRGELNLMETDQIRFGKDRIETKPEAMNEGIMFHDRNNRDLEVTMKDLAENAIAHNAGVELLKNQFEMLKMAIRGQVS
ncbi:Flagellar basal body rod protein FlgB [Poriferisphaera corsica]|uniref:Flagellar basal body rod protein FlgB n=1 Tax=Poriferisphaera corsica TaxID=2528020 RepID=A0A517YSN7_9BACT|nr:flagellar basal body rod protein FlgB [Poriferisphaera corsica]QDU33162.1 Flagellar basal body rod protein FlgB [Poriferisphaera corsica]